MARRGTATAESGSDVAGEVADLAPNQSTFTDPVRADRAETPEKEAPPAGPVPPPIPEPEPQPGPDDAYRGAGVAPTPGETFDARSEVERLRGELALQQQRAALFEREVAFRAAALQQQLPQPSAVRSQVDPILQEVIDILQITDDDLVEVFAGGPKAAQIVSQALQTTALLAVNAAERRLVQYYQRDQQGRQQQQVVESRSQQMHTEFWSNFPELAEHEVIVQHFAAQVAAEQAQNPRFDWNTAQAEVARRTVDHLTQRYNVQFAQGTGVAAAPQGMRRQAPPLQQRLRPAFGEMGGGQSARAGTPSNQQQLTAEILDLGLAH